MWWVILTVYKIILSIKNDVSAKYLTVDILFVS